MKYDYYSKYQYDGFGYFGGSYSCVFFFCLGGDDVYFDLVKECGFVKKILVLIFGLEKIMGWLDF